MAVWLIAYMQINHGSIDTLVSDENDDNCDGVDDDDNDDLGNNLGIGDVDMFLFGFMFMAGPFS